MTAVDTSNSVNTVGVLDASGGCSGNATYNISGTTINNPVNIPGTDCGASHVLTTAVTILLVVATIISFLMLLWGGVQYILSSGDPKGVSSARGRIMYAVIGMVVSFLAIGIWTLVGHILGFSL